MVMKPFSTAVIALAVLGVAPRARGACGWSGTQIECDLGGRRHLQARIGVHADGHCCLPTEAFDVLLQRRYQP